MTPKLVYIAGPYRAPTAWQCEQNIRDAEAVGYFVALLGAYPIIPHTKQFWLGGTLELMRRCDGVVFLKTWQSSSGARAERIEAERLGLPIFGVAHLHSGQFEAWLRGGNAP